MSGQEVTTFLFDLRITGLFLTKGRGRKKEELCSDVKTGERILAWILILLSGR
jgi:hypothetical protein